MQKLFLKFSGLAVLLTLLIATGCEEDTIDPINQLPPAVSLIDGVGLTSTDAVLAPGETFTVNVEILTGDNPIETFTFLVDGIAVSNTDISNYYAGGEFALDGSVETANNPVTLFGDAKQGALIEIAVVPFGQMDGEVKTYTFEAIDEGGNVGTASLDITIEDPTTPLDATLTGVLFNQAGPADTGGLDLDTGEGTGSSDADSEIRDLGLDCTVPAPGLNWRRQVGTINGADMVKVDATQVENFTFDNVSAKEEIEAAYSTGIALSDGVSVSCASGNETAVTDVTEELVAGDMFVVAANGTNYLIRIDAVNETDNSNTDSYELSIKF
jgi:hypothetical protein